VAFQEYVNILERMAKQPLSKEVWSKKVINNLKQIEDRRNAHDFFKTQMAKRDAPNRLNDKLYTVLENREFIKHLVTNDIKQFCDKVSATRNWHTHPRSIKPNNIIARDEMYNYTSALSIIVHCLILIELGMDEAFLIKRLKVLYQLRPKNEYISFVSE